MGHQYHAIFHYLNRSPPPPQQKKEKIRHWLLGQLKMWTVGPIFWEHSVGFLSPCPKKTFASYFFWTRSRVNPHSAYTNRVNSPSDCTGSMHVKPRNHGIPKKDIYINI